MPSLFRKIIFLCIYIPYLYAYELPSISLEANNNAEIILFSAESVLVDERPSYVIRWKTLNATKVTISYIGEIALSGEGTITAEEYQKGPITLIAFNADNGSKDTKIINKHIEAEKDAPVLNFKVTERDYFEGGIPRTYYRPRNPRRIH